MTDNIIIRPAIPADIPALVNHRRWMFIDIARLRDEEIDPVLLDKMDLVYGGYLETHFKNGTTHAWVATDQECIIAGAVLTVIPGLPSSYNNLEGILPYIHDVYTQPQCRRRGLARALVQSILEFSRQQGYSVVKLHASSEGRAIYESLGFTATNEMRILFSA
jgi:ribosomal protein S18 acetylase RimI-like enzyme